MTAGRPLKGKITKVPSGFRVEVPVSRGSAKRVQATFPAKSIADKVLANALDVLNGGGAVHDLRVLLPATKVVAPKPATGSEPPIAKATPAPTKATCGHRTFTQVAADLIMEKYEDGQHASATRQDDVPRIIDLHLTPFMEANGYLCGCDIERSVYHKWLTALAAGDVQSTVYVDGDREYTIAEAVAATGASESTINRDIKSGVYSGGHRDAFGRWLIPASDLQAAGRLTAGPTRARRTHPDGYRSPPNIRGVMHRILKHGRSSAGWQLRFDPDDVKTPRLPAAQKRRHLTLADAARMATHLHVAHQFAFWMVRVLGLRIGEAYGIRVRDVTFAGNRAIIRVAAQGGRTMLERDPATRKVIKTKRKKTLKNAQSPRVIVAPHQFASLIALVIDIFHTSPSGEIEEDAQLIPMLNANDGGGQQALRSALKAAGEKAGIYLGNPDEPRHARYLPTPKDGRSGITTDLAIAGVDYLATRRFVGHLAGSDVHDRHYILDDPELRPMHRVAQELERLIDEELPDGLLIPTYKPVTTRMQPRLRDQNSRIDGALMAAGWYQTRTTAEGAGIMTATELAQQLGVTPNKARRLIEDTGMAQAENLDGREQYVITTQDALALQEALAQRRTINDVAASHGLTYHQVYQLIERHSLEVERDPAGSAVYVSEAAERWIGQHLEQRAALLARTYTYEEVSRLLDVPYVIVQELVRKGWLTVECEVGPGNRKLVTKSSVVAYLAPSERLDAS